MIQYGRAAAYLSSPYWCVYSAQCIVRLFTVHCTHHVQTMHVFNYFILILISITNYHTNYVL